jgi:dihydroorotase
MRKLLIKDGRILDPGHGLDMTGSLFIAGGKVSWVGRDNPPPGSCDILSARGLIVCPGFIDLHCHLRQPGFEEKETIATGTLAAARGGFTTVCCMPNTSPPLDNQTAIEFIKTRAAAEGVIRVLPIGCITRGRKGEELAEMGELAASGAVACSDDGEPVSSSWIMRQALDYSRAFDLPVIDHCEDKALTKDGQMNEGLISTRLGLRGIPAAAEVIMVGRDLALADLTGGRMHIAHVSTAAAVELIRRAKARGTRVTAEVTPHHLTLTEEAVRGYDTNAKVNPPLRTAEDIEALIAGLKDGTLDAIATDHAPHTAADKLCEFDLAPSGISGLETALGALMSLVHGGRLDLALLIGKLTAGPAGIIGGKYPGLGTLAAGSPADVAIIDPGREWVVDPASFASKGKNTPLAGRLLKGKVVATIFGGNIVYKDESVSLEEP